MGTANLHLRIRAFRKLKGHTQQDLAELLGVSIAVLGQIERGTRKPSGLMMQRIAQVLAVDLEELNPPASS